MKSPLDEFGVRKVARLARLHLSDEEARLFAGQLSEILGYMDQLRELDTEGVEPLVNPLALHDVLRDDVPRPGLTTEQALANAPDQTDGHFRVPAVFDPSAGA